MRAFRLMHLAMFMGLLASCSQEPPSHLKEGSFLDGQTTTATIRSIDIQPGAGRDPRVCVVKGDGQLSCYGKEKPKPSYKSFRVTGHLKEYKQRCAVTEYSRVVCSTEGNEDAIEAPRNDDFVHALAFAGSREMCALLPGSNGPFVKCYGPQTIPDTAMSSPEVTDSMGKTQADDIVSIYQTRYDGTGDRYLCGLTRGGQVPCRNLNPDYFGGEGEGGLLRTISLALSNKAKCRVYEDNSLSCSGLPIGSTANIPVGVATAGALEVTGRDETLCVRYQNGDFACWIQDKVFNRRRFATMQPVLKVEANSSGICGVFADEKIRCLEPNSGSLVTYEDPKADQIVAYGDQTCAYTYDGKSSCWGANLGFELPKNIPFPDGTEVAVGNQHVCSINNGKVSCQGDASHDQKNIPATLNQAYALSVVAADDHTCALDSKGAVTCWGQSIAGATTAPALIGAKKIATGKDLSCAITADNKLNCWGNTSGELSIPASVGDVMDVAIGDKHVCVLDINKQALCWGDPAFGKTVPEPNASGYRSLSAGANHTCAISDIGSFLSCWGKDTQGQTIVPERFLVASRVSLGREHTCALDDKNHLGCWGKPLAADVAAALEDVGVVNRQDYKGSILRHLPFQSKLETCDSSGACRLPDEPVISFSGLNLTGNPVTETYALKVSYQSSCPVEFYLNASVSPDLIRSSPGETNVKEALFYRTPIADNDSLLNANGLLQGAALLQVRYRWNGILQRELPAGCSVSIRNVTIVPAVQTRNAWRGYVENTLTPRLEQALARLADFNRYDGIVASSYQTNAIQLHRKARENMLQKVRDAIALAEKLPTPIEDLPQFPGLDQETVNAQLVQILMNPIKVPMFSNGGQVQELDSFEMKPLASLPRWYTQARSRVVRTARIDIDAALNLYSLSTSVLKAPFSAVKSNTEIKRMAYQLGRADLDKALLAATNFINSTEVLIELLNSDTQSKLQTVRNALQDKITESEGKRQAAATGANP